MPDGNVDAKIRGSLEIVHYFLFVFNFNAHHDTGGLLVLSKMAVILLTMFWNSFSWISVFELRVKIHWYVFLMVVQMTMNVPRQWISSALVQIMACRLLRAKPLSANAGLLSIVLPGTNLSEILTKIWNLSFTKMHLEISSAKWRPFCPGRDELNLRDRVINWSIFLRVSLLNEAGCRMHASANWHQIISGFSPVGPKPILERIVSYC